MCVFYFQAAKVSTISGSNGDANGIPVETILNPSKLEEVVDQEDAAEAVEEAEKAPPAPPTRNGHGKGAAKTNGGHSLANG